MRKVLRDPRLLQQVLTDEIDYKLLGSSRTLQKAVFVNMYNFFGQQHSDIGLVRQQIKWIIDNDYFVDLVL